MKLVNVVLLASMSISSVVLAGSATDGKNAVRMYRYINAQGTRVTSSQIPPEYAKRGYQVVNMGGDVLEEVAAELTEAERAQLELAQQGKVSQAQQAEQDKQLLLRYSSPDELKNAQSRKLAEIESNIKTLQANISSIHHQIEFEQEKAANYERNGKAVPPMSLQKLEALNAELKTTNNLLASRQQELENNRTRFAEEGGRYQNLYEKRTKAGKK